MKQPASLQLRIAVVVAIVILAASITAVLFVRHELLEAEGEAVAALEYGELLGVLAPFAIAAPIAAYAAAYWSLRPLARIAQDADAVSPRNLSQRLSEERAPREALGLVKAVNGALDRLAAAYAHDRQFIADAAHALRTPLAVLSLRLQRAADEGLVDPDMYGEDMQRLQRIVKQLLTLERIDAIETRPMEMKVDLSRVARTVAAELLPIAESRNRSLEVLAEQSHFAEGDGNSIGEAVRNLVENALLHGEGKVCIDTGRCNGTVWISVADQGPGPAPELRDRSFSRFVRSSRSRGTGLGLSIARDAARAYGGDIEWGSGSRIRLTLNLPSSSAHSCDQIRPRLQRNRSL